MVIKIIIKYLIKVITKIFINKFKSNIFVNLEIDGKEVRLKFKINILSI